MEIKKIGLREILSQNLAPNQVKKMKGQKSKINNNISQYER